MFQTIRNAFKNPDLRKRMLFTAFVLVIFRLGSCLILPFVDTSVIGSAVDSVLKDQNSLFGMLNLFSGNAFGNATIFALSISPYITASIIVQLLTVAIPPLERMAKEGETGRKKLNRVTKWITLAMAALQGYGYYTIVRWQLHALVPEASADAFGTWFCGIVIVLCLIGGAFAVTWLGDQITEKGVGNGISVLLFAGILAGMPGRIGVLWQKFMDGIAGGTADVFFVPFIVLVFVAMIVFIVIMTDAERRIPVQYAKRVVGRKMYGGQSSFVPIKVNMSSVLPIIFANSLLAIPATIASFTSPQPGSFWANFRDLMSPSGWIYMALYFVLIIGFNYFYVAVQYNPVEMANNIKNNNGAIPGIRPGKPTSSFIKKVMSKIVLIGALFLAVIAIFPIIFANLTGVQVALGGTSIIIVVGVALETMKQLESQLMMRHHKGFLE